MYICAKPSFLAPDAITRLLAVHGDIAHPEIDRPGGVRALQTRWRRHPEWRSGTRHCPNSATACSTRYRVRGRTAASNSRGPRAWRCSRPRRPCQTRRWILQAERSGCRRHFDTRSSLPARPPERRRSRNPFPGRRTTNPTPRRHLGSRYRCSETGRGTTRRSTRCPLRRGAGISRARMW